MTHLRSTLWLWLILLIISACQKEAEKNNHLASNIFADPVFIEIYEHIDKRDTKALLKFLDDANAAYREAAVMGLGSVQDSVAIPYLALALNDTRSKVRVAAAYALGQSYDTAAITPLAQALPNEDSLKVRKTILEALGRVITQERLELLQYWAPKTSADKEGIAWGLYRAGIRNVHDGISIDIALSLLDTANTYETRLGAAHFLARSRQLNLSGREPLIIRSATTDPSPDIRMASTAALRNIRSQRTFTALTEAILKDKDYRVRINAIYALINYSYTEVEHQLLALLADDNVNVQIAASAMIKTMATASPGNVLEQRAFQHSNSRVRSNLLHAALRLSSDREGLKKQIYQAYNEAPGPYDKAALLEALSGTISAHEFIITETFAAKHPAIRTAGILALVAQRGQKDFPQELTQAYADIFKQAIETADVALVTIVADAIRNERLNMKPMYASSEFLHKAKAKLSLPKDNEALQALNKTIAYIDSTEATPTVNGYNNPIDWKLVKKLQNNHPAIIQTARGQIKLRLFTNTSPGSVANFVALARDHYFDGKNFHRVVPNFVVQGGCNRGDGYGGEDYSIRSELSNLQYYEGAVGMASAGKDTEGTQWFITHSPTPHLDGRYTIFAQVTEGMEVVHKLQVGDKINSIEIPE